jgi:ParB family chromosome partitioning protein
MSTTLTIDQIDMRADARPIDAATVAGLVDSISTVGLINPIRVREVNGRWQLIAGAHRLQACRDLGLAEIEAVLVADDDLHAELAMIDENLCRAELSPSDRARQTARRKAIYEALHPATSHGGDHMSSKSQSLRLASAPERFTENTAKATGKSERLVQLNAERGEKVIDEALDLIRGTELDTGTYLDKIKKLSPNDQVTAVNRDLLLARRNERAAKSNAALKLADTPLNDFEAKEKQVAALMSAWNRASPEAREEFMGRIDTPTMDRRYG